MFPMLLAFADLSFFQPLILHRRGERERGLSDDDTETRGKYVPAGLPLHTKVRDTLSPDEAYFLRLPLPPGLGHVGSHTTSKLAAKAAVATADFQQERVYEDWQQSQQRLLGAQQWPDSTTAHSRMLVRCASSLKSLTDFFPRIQSKREMP